MTAPRGITPPNLPVAPVDYQQRYQDQFSNVLRLFFSSVTNYINGPASHGAYYDTTTQTNPVANTVNLFKFNTKISQFLVTRGVPPTKIFVQDTGLYNVQFSAQFDKVGGGKATIYIWPRINGVNVPDSATKIVIAGPNDEIVPAWNFLLLLRSGDYFELAWQSSDTDVIVLADVASGNVPGIPSIILTVNWVSNSEA